MNNVDKLRQKYLNNPPLGYSELDVSNMSDEELLDMDYFLNEDLGDIFNSTTSNSCVLEAIQFKCKNCGCIEFIPKNIVDTLDSQLGVFNFPPTFSCDKCSVGIMTPINYKSPRGFNFKFNT